MQRDAYRVALAFATLLLLVAANTLVKSTRDAVFLSRFGLTEMSLLAVGLAVVAGGVASAYRRWADRQSRPRLIALSHGAIAISLVGMWAGLRAQIEAFTWLVFVWSSLFGAFLIMQFWLIASELFDVREARRAFGTVGAGAIVGGILGGLGASQLAGIVSAESLLLVAAVALMVAAASSWLAWNSRPTALGRPAAKKTDREGDGDGDPHRLVRSLGAALLLSAVATTLLDWQLKAIAKRSFADDPEALASFFGSIFAYQSIASLAIQLLIAPWLLRRWGMGTSRGALPFVLLLGAVAIVGHGSLAIGLLTIVSVARVGEAAVRYGVERPATELTWLPLDAATRAKGKAFVDTVVDRLGTGAAGAVWLAAAALGFDEPGLVHWVAVPIALTAAGWIWVNRDVQRRYVATFRAGLSGRTIDLEALTNSLASAEARSMLVEALESPDPARARFAVDILADQEDAPLPDLAPLLDHDDDDLRVQVLKLLTARADGSAAERAKTLLADDHRAVRSTATRYLARVSPTTVSIDESAVVALWDPARAADAEARLRSAIAEGDNRSMSIASVAAAPPDAAERLLEPMLTDEDPNVVRAALAAAGASRAHGLRTAIAALLADRRWRRFAVEALVDTGGAVEDDVLTRAEDESLPEEARRALVRAAGASADQRALPVLLRLLERTPAPMGFAAARAIARLRRSVGALIPADLVRRAAGGAARELYADLVLLGRGGWPNARTAQDDEDLFTTAVRERADRRARDILVLLELIYAPEDVLAAARGLESGEAAARAHGLELLDNVLTPSDRALLLPMFDETAPAAMTAAARRAGVEPVEHTAAVQAATEGNDPWLRAVALGMIRPDRVGATLTLVERALKLRSVDVLRNATTEALSRVAQVAEEIDLDDGATLYDAGDPPDALYVVLSGGVRLTQGDVEIDVAKDGDVFGSWALVDDAPRIAKAQTVGPSRLLRVTREDFADVLADRPEIVEAVFKAMVGQIRGLTGLLRGDAP